MEGWKKIFQWHYFIAFKIFKITPDLKAEVNVLSLNLSLLTR